MNVSENLLKVREFAEKIYGLGTKVYLEVPNEHTNKWEIEAEDMKGNCFNLASSEDSLEQAIIDAFDFMKNQMKAEVAEKQNIISQISSWKK
jgi:hypothetical protein